MRQPRVLPDVSAAVPTENAARIALRTQQVIGYESGVSATADPLGGSYAIEHLTDEIERLAAEYIDKIDQIGGMLQAIEKGYVQREIERAAYEYQRGVESGEQVVVGLNRFTSDEAATVPLLKIDSELETKQVERLNRVRAQRDARQTNELLGEVERSARTDENLMPHIVRAVEGFATLGEISDRLRAVFGEYKGEIYD